MIYINFPIGCYHGWGICGKYISREMAKITDIKFITNNITGNLQDDPISYHSLKTKLADEALIKQIISGVETCLDSPVLQAITSIEFKPLNLNLKGTKNVGYTFFENDIIPQIFIENAKKNFDVIIAGATWCEEVLRSYNLENIKTVIQGIDPQIFNPINNEKEFLEDKFVIFSGGKFELRKGQDIVIKAFKILQDKYDDVMLINSWNNMWESSFSTIKMSPHIVYPFDPAHRLNLAQKQVAIINYIIQANGIDLNKVITLPPQANPTMATIYKNTDIGLFPNKCEGGTNLVLMEYMACGKPVIASFNTGHKDILTAENSLMIQNMKKFQIGSNPELLSNWYDPDIDETVSLLESAYLDWKQNRKAKLNVLGKQAGEDLAKLTWKKTAKEFYDILVN